MDNIIYEYDAFISYRHREPDITIARKLLPMLEGYKPPKNIRKNVGPKKITKIFRDREELPTTSDLNSSIINALTSSRYLIVICSPRTRESEWIRKEVEVFRELHGVERIQTFLIEGEPEEAFPEPLQTDSNIPGSEDNSASNNKFEFLAADIRPDELKGKHRVCYGQSPKMDHKLLKKSLRLMKTEKLRCLAPMFGCKFDDLYQRHLRRFLHRTIAAAAFIVTGLAAIVSYTLYMNNALRNEKSIAVMQKNEAVHQKQLATEEQKKAEQQKNLALKNQSKQLADLAMEQMDGGDRYTAALLALEALPKDLVNPERPLTIEGEAALRNVMIPHLHGFYCSSIIRDFTGNVSDRHIMNNCLLTITEEGKIKVWDLLKGSIKQSSLNQVENVESAVFSPDGRQILIVSEEHTITIWDYENDNKLYTFTDHTSKVTNAFYSPDGNSIVTASEDGLIIIYDSRTYHVKKTIHDIFKQTISVSMSPDNSILAIRSFDTKNNEYLSLWDLVDDAGPSFQMIQSFTQLVFSPDSNYIALVDSGNISILNMKDKSKIAIQAHENWINDITFSPDSRFVATCSSDRTIKLWGVDGYQYYNLEGHTDRVNTVTFSPDGQYIVTSSSDNTARIWDLNLTQGMYDDSLPYVYQVLQGHNTDLTSALFSSDSSYIVTVSNDQTCRVWRKTSTESLKVFPVNDTIHSASFSYDGKYLGVATEYNDAWIWDVNTGEKVRELTGHDFNTVHTISFSHNGEWVLTGGYAKPKLWDLKSGQELQCINEDLDDINSIFFSPDDKYIITLTEQNLQMWSSDTFESLREFTGHSEKINSAAFNPEGSLLISSADDYTARIWDVNTGKEIMQLSHPTKAVHSAVFSPDGQYIATIADDLKCYLWRAKDGSLIRTLENCTDRVSFSKNSAYMLTGNNINGTAGTTVWETHTFKPILTLDGYDAAFSPDDKSIMTQYKDEIILWPFENLSTIMKEAGTMLAGRVLTEEERDKFNIEMK